jgi:hypothetical protein
MMKFNREKIIKALEICSDETKEFCTGCPFIGNGGCKQSSILKLALSLIKELTEELEKERTWADSMIDNLRDDVRELTIENERLKKLCKNYGIFAKAVLEENK